MLQKYKFEICQNLIHTQHGAVDQDWRSKSHARRHVSQPPDRSKLALLRLPAGLAGVPLNPTCFMVQPNKNARSLGCVETTQFQ